MNLQLNQMNTGKAGLVLEAIDKVAPSLGNSLLLIVIRVRINILCQMPWCGHLSVGETIDILMPEVGRVRISWTQYARPD